MFQVPRCCSDAALMCREPHWFRRLRLFLSYEPGGAEAHEQAVYESELCTGRGLADRAIGGLPRLLAGTLNRLFAGFFSFGAPLALVADFLKLVIGEMFDPDKGIMRRADANEFVQLDLNGGAIAVLRILDQEHHQEGDDGRARVDDELPGV